jgi:putative tricarboxylic transport membrane protein
MLGSQGSLSAFWSNPLVASITVFSLVMLLWPLWGAAKNLTRKRHSKGAAA